MAEEDKIRVWSNDELREFKKKDRARLKKELIRELDSLPECHCKSCKDREHFRLVQWRDVRYKLDKVFKE